ncbi:MAG: ATP-binding protein [Bacteroidota bacterium]
MIQRILATKVLQQAAKMPVLTVTGPRQSGKSTLVKQAFPDYTYVNLEKPEVRKFARQDPNGFLSQYGSRVIIDEVQYVPDLPSYIQVLVDEDDQAGRFILTGSQNLLLMQQVSQSLAGRTAMFTLLPFSVQELKDSPYKSEQFEDYVVKGFYPRIYDKNLNPTEWLMDYVLNYVERDVRQLINLPDADTFSQFVSICAGRIGQTVNFSEVGALIGVSYQTVKRWLSILKTSYLVYTLRPYHKNYNKRIVKAPKLYFYDTGLACALLNIKTPEEYHLHFAKGALFENFIINEVQKRYYNLGKRPNLYFWRTQSGHEVDLIIDEGTEIYPVEIKAGRTIHTQFFKGLNFFSRQGANSLNKTFLIYGGDDFQHRTYATVLGWKYLNQIFD